MPAPDTLELTRWLYRFHAWARPHVTDAAQSTPLESLQRTALVPGGNDEGSAFGTLVHLVSTEALWVARWQGEARARRRGTVDYPDIAAIVSHWEQVEADRAAFLESLGPADIDRPLEYYSGQLGRMEVFPLWQTLIHVSNHMTHHRAEASAALTGLGVPPSSVDLLDFMREQG